MGNYKIIYGRCKFELFSFLLWQMQIFPVDRPGRKPAVFVLVRDLTQDKVLAGIEEFRGKSKVSTSSLSQSDEAVLRQVLEAD